VDPSGVWPRIACGTPQFNCQIERFLPAEPNRPIKVVRIVAGMDARIGGPPESARNSAIAASRAGIETTVACTLSGEGPGIAEAIAALRAEGIEVATFPATRLLGRFGARWGVSFGLGWWLLRRAHSFDVIHAHGAWVLGAVIAVAFGALARRKRALTPHEALTRFDIDRTPRRLTKLGKRLLLPFLLRGFDLFVMSSRLEARDSLDDRALARAVVAFHPVYDERARAPQRRGQPIGDEGLRLGFLGRFHPKKNLDLVIRTLPRLPDRITLAVAGDGPAELAGQYRALADELAVAGRIAWLGFVQGEAKEEFFRNIDLFVMPSAYECFGMAAAEAMLRGIPALVSPETGIAEVIAPHRCGALCPPAVDELARAILSLAGSRDELARYSANAAAAARDVLSFSAHGKALAKAYAGLFTPRG